MASNFPGPYQLRIYYTVTPTGLAAMQHVYQMNIDLDNPPDLGDDFADIDVKARLVASHPLSTVTDEIVALMVPHFDATEVTIDYAELWAYTPGKFDATYITVYAINEAGTSLDDTHPASQLIYTFRTYEGGVGRAVLMETTNVPGASVVYADMSVDAKAFADYYTGASDSFFLARDTSYHFICLAVHPGENEKTFKKRYRE